MPGPWELLALLVLVLLLFGSKRLPDLARGLGRSITDFKAGLNEDKSPDAKETKVAPVENKSEIN